MATIDVGGGRGGRRELNHTLPLVPFIDFLLCILAFLLVTAVWSELSRLDASAKVPSIPTDVAQPSKGELHVDMRGENRFLLEWRDGTTVLAQEEVPRVAPAAREAAPRFPELSRRVRELWTQRGAHRAPTDAARDRAVLHTSNTASFDEIVGAMDAIAMTRRDALKGAPQPAFDMVFAVD
jgi:biopolymer transport protein ExbD